MHYFNNKKALYFTVFCLLIISGIRLYYYLTDDFRVSNIRYHFPFESFWPTPTLNSDEQKELQLVLDQTFHYIGKGAQCYAFESEDQNYVIKFFKFKHLKPSLFVNSLPDYSFFKDYKERCIARKKRKLIGIFNSYDLAFRENRENAGLIYIHLNPSPFFHPSIKVKNKMGMPLTIQLDDLVFLIQKKGITLHHYLKTRLNEDKIEPAKNALRQILDMYINEYERGLFDHDHGVMQNTGFVDERAFHLDVGKLLKEDKMRTLDYSCNDLKHVIWKMDCWIKKHYPQHQLELSRFLENYYKKITGKQLQLNAIEASDFPRKRLYHQ